MPERQIVQFQNPTMGYLDEVPAEIVQPKKLDETVPFGAYQEKRGNEYVTVNAFGQTEEEAKTNPQTSEGFNTIVDSKDREIAALRARLAQYEGEDVENTQTQAEANAEVGVPSVPTETRGGRRTATAPTLVPSAPPAPDQGASEGEGGDEGDRVPPVPPPPGS